MLTYPTITTILPKAISRRFGDLREEAIAELQALSGAIWTDYNLHDPGVTLVEQLIYAITDLGYKVDHDVATLLASHMEGPIDLGEHFHRAKYILPNCPYTPADYRRYFLDIPGVQNVFLQLAPNVCPFIYCRTEVLDQATVCDATYPSLAFNRDLTINNWSIADWERLHLNGLYCASLILESDVAITAGSAASVTNLASGTLSTVLNAGPQAIPMTVSLPPWVALIVGVWNNPRILVRQISFIENLREVANGTFEGLVNVQLGRRRRLEEVPIRIQVSQRPRPVIRSAIPRRRGPQFGKIPVISTAWTNGRMINILSAFVADTSTEGLFPQWQQSIISATAVVSEMKARYCAKRNLCEDLKEVKLCKPQDVVLKAAIDLELGVDPEQVLAQLFCEIEDYLQPQAHFYSLAELQTDGMGTEEIFEGPRLQHGFLKEDEVKALKQRKAVHHSDLIRIMACQEGVIAVRDLLTCSFIGQEEVVSNERNCFLLEDSECYHFRLDIDRSLANNAICCFQSGSLVTLDIAEVKARYQKIKASQQQRQLQDDCLTLPEGQAVDLSYWHSVQYDLPRVYGVGADGLGRSATAVQKGRAKQTKAFLFFFEQMMANYLSQLSQVGELFSMDALVNRTYFHQSLYHLPNIDSIFQARLNNGQDWDTFIADVQNDYMQALDKATESEMQFYERRNRFLDHLLARVGENVAHYEGWVRNYYRQDPAFVLLELIRVKQHLIANYPALSSPRATAFNYCKKRPDGTPDVWDTDNVSGYLKRVCAKVGLYNCQRRSLCLDAVYPNVFEIFDETDTDGITEWWFRLRDDDGTILMTASDRYTSYPNLLAALHTVTQLGMYRDNFEIRQSNANRFYFLLRNGNDTLARRIPGFLTEEEAEETIQRIMDILWHHFNGEGIHLIEHILLRPQNSNYNLLEPFQCGTEKRRRPRIIKDPYSFVMTLVLPSGYKRDFSDDANIPQPTVGSPRLRDLAYRQVVEQVLQEEAPAHLNLNIYWLDCDTSNNTTDYLSLNRFENLYRNWLEQLTLSENILQGPNDKMVKFINELLPVFQRPI